MSTPPDVLTKAEVAERLGVTTVTIGRWAEDGRITPMRRDPWLAEAAEFERLRQGLLTEAEARVAELRAAALPAPAPAP